jgi:hypothetical protein
VASQEVISVFLASPSDLETERAIAREIVETTNRRIAKHHGISIQLYGWEDQPPGFGRPQGLINEEVDTADLFIGLLWRRWGTPSSVDFSSGFEEEYCRARDRRVRTEKSPEIWLFFKEIDEGQRSDPGPELQRVSRFAIRSRKTGKPFTTHSRTRGIGARY